jgi:hypothetical protein
MATTAYLAVALALLWPLPLRLTSAVPGDPLGDPLLNAWILGWGADRLAAGLQGLWDAPIFYPHRDTFAWSEHLLGVTAFVAPIYWLTHNVVLTYNVALLGSIVLAGVGMYVLVLELTGSRGAAWLAGLTFACLPYRAAHITHLQLLVAGWMPVALYGLHRYMRDGSRRAIGLLAIGYGATALSNGYYLFYFGLALAIAAVWLLAERARRHQRLRGRVAGLLVVACVVAAAIAPVAAAYLRVRATYGFSRDRTEMARYSARPGDYVTVSPATAVWRDVLPPAEAERELFPGLTLTTLAIAGLAAGWRRNDVRLYAVIGVTAFVMTLGPTPTIAGHALGTGPYDWLRGIPGVNGLRVPARFAMIVYLAMSVLAGIALAGAARRLPRRVQVGGAAVLCIALFVEGRPTVPVMAARGPRVSPQTAYQWLREQPRGPMLELPVGRAAEGARYLPGTLVHRNPIVNGYSGYSSRLVDFFGGPPSLEPGHATSLVDAARAVGVRYLLVHQTHFPDRAFARRMVEALGAVGPERIESLGLYDTTAVLTLAPMTVPERRPEEAILATAGCSAQGFPNASGMDRAIDGRGETRWVSGPSQQGDEWFALTCPAPRVLTGLAFELARRSLSNYPRSLVVEVSTDGEQFQPVFAGSVLPLLAQALATSRPEVVVSVPVDPARFRVVRLRQTAKAERPSFWAIDEIRLHGRP